MKLKRNIRYIYLIVSFLLVSNIFINNESFAVGTAKVLTVNENIEKVSENEFLIPVYISNNTGIMGFRLEFIYDKNQIDLNYVTKGNVTKTGSFDSVIDTSGDWGNASAIWYHTENVTSNGTVAYISVSPKGNYDKRVIRIGYVVEDTFNESWEDVALECYNIELKGETDEDLSDENTDQNDEGTSIKTINDVTSEDLVERDFNNNDSSMVEVSKGMVELSEKASTSAEEDAVKEEIDAETEVEAQLEARKEGNAQRLPDDFANTDIKQYAIDELAKRGVKSLDEIPEAEKKAYWESVKTHYLKDHTEMNEILKDVDFSFFEEKISISSEEIEQASPNRGGNSIIVIISVVAVIMLVIVVVIRRRQKHGTNKE